MDEGHLHVFFKRNYGVRDVMVLQKPKERVAKVVVVASRVHKKLAIFVEVAPHGYEFLLV